VLFMGKRKKKKKNHRSRKSSGHSTASRKRKKAAYGPGTRIRSPCLNSFEGVEGKKKRSVSPGGGKGGKRKKRRGAVYLNGWGGARHLAKKGGRAPSPEEKKKTQIWRSETSREKGLRFMRSGNRKKKGLSIVTRKQETSDSAVTRTKVRRPCYCCGKKGKKERQRPVGGEEKETKERLASFFNKREEKKKRDIRIRDKILTKRLVRYTPGGREKGSHFDEQHRTIEERSF